MNSLFVKVLKKLKLAEGIVGFELVDVNGGQLPQFSAGSHIDVFVSTNVIRQYSLYNDPIERNRYQIGVLLDPQSRGGSVAMHSSIEEGQTIKISPPRNNFKLVNSSKSLLFAGGIGITPILSMARELFSEGKEFQLHYFGRSLSKMAFVNDLTNCSFSDSVYFHVDDDTNTSFKEKDYLDCFRPDVNLYVCGPSGFIDYINKTALFYGWNINNLHKEFFKSVQLESTAGNDIFQVKISSSGKLFDIPSDKTVLQVLLDNSIDIQFSCETGVCGTCLTGISSGIPLHLDSFLTDSEKEKNNQFTPCCSRSKSSCLVLDL